MSKIYKYKCDHIEKESSLFNKTISIDDYCPACKKKLQKLNSFYSFEKEHNLDHFSYTPNSLQKALIATETRFRLLNTSDCHWLEENGLYGYLNDLMGDLRPQADELIRRTNIIIRADIDFYYSWKNKTLEDLIKYIEIGDLPY